MVRLGMIAMEETPLFAALVDTRGGSFLFEDWKPTPSEVFAREMFHRTEDENAAEYLDNVADGTFARVLTLHKKPV